VHGTSLGVATHGRSFWIIDDLSPLRQWSEAISGEKAHLFQPAPANHTAFATRPTETRDPAAANPPGGAVFYYALDASFPKAPVEDADKDEAAKTKAGKGEKKPPSRLKLEILDAEGHVIRAYPDPHALPPDDSDDEEEGGRGRGAPKLAEYAGLNQFAWDLRYEGATPIAHSPLWAGSVQGAKALPGRYAVRLTVDGVSQTQPFEIVPDPRLSVTPAQLQQQFELHSAVNAELTEVHQAVLDIRSVRARIRAAQAKTPSVAAAGNALDAKMTAVEEVLIQPRAHASEDALNYPIQLNNMLAALGAIVGEGDNPPTDQDRQMFAELKGRADAQLAVWRELKAKDIPAFDRMAGAS
jgi:hypothetical protein